jgi:hypothetical protein
MRKTALRCLLLAASSFGCAAAHAQSMLECPPPPPASPVPCAVDITVHVAADGACTVTAFPTRLMVHRPNDMHFRLRTPGWRFGPEKDIHFKDPAAAGGRLLPANLFSRRMQQSDLRVIVIHNRYDKEQSPPPPPEERGEFPYSITVVKDDGSKTCTLDPVVVNN